MYGTSALLFAAMTYQAIETHPTVMSKMLLPTQLDTAMSPQPLRATITLVMRSGLDIPAARIITIGYKMAMVSSIYMRKQAFRIENAEELLRTKTNILIFTLKVDAGLCEHCFVPVYISRQGKTFQTFPLNFMTLTDPKGPPHHEVGDDSNPQDRAQEGDHTEFSGFLLRKYKNTQLI